MQSSIGQNFILFSAILAKGKLGTRRGTWSESNTGHGPCWPGFGAAYATTDPVCELIWAPFAPYFRAQFPVSVVIHDSYLVPQNSDTAWISCMIHM